MSASSENRYQREYRTSRLGKLGFSETEYVTYRRLSKYGKKGKPTFTRRIAKLNQSFSLQEADLTARRFAYPWEQVNYQITSDVRGLKEVFNFYDNALSAGAQKYDVLRKVLAKEDIDSLVDFRAYSRRDSYRAHYNAEERKFIAKKLLFAKLQRDRAARTNN